MSVDQVIVETFEALNKEMVRLGAIKAALASTALP